MSKVPLRALLPLPLLGLLLIFLVSLAPLPLPQAERLGLASASAAPVQWREVPANAAGRQWWDAGSLRRDRHGKLTVLSRFQPAARPGIQDDSSGAPSPQSQRQTTSKPYQPLATLYVMELDCVQARYRDLSINGLPQWKPAWQDSQHDPLTSTTLQQACLAADPAATGSLDVSPPSQGGSEPRTSLGSTNRSSLRSSHG
jgi:hypothetical protein